MKTVTSPPVANSTIPKIEGAVHQLDVAIRLFLEGDYLSSLTLAGAAEEILGKLSAKAGHAVSLKEIIAYHLPDVDPAIEEKKRSKTLADIANKARNAAKHVISEDDADFTIEQVHPLQMIMRAMPMARTLGVVPSREKEMVAWIQTHPEARQ